MTHASFHNALTIHTMSSIINSMFIQAEIDSLTKRAKHAEAAYVTIHQLLYDAPDVVPILRSFADMASRVAAAEQHSRLQQQEIEVCGWKAVALLLDRVNSGAVCLVALGQCMQVLVIVLHSRCALEWLDTCKSCLWRGHFMETACLVACPCMSSHLVSVFVAP